MKNTNKTLMLLSGLFLLPASGAFAFQFLAPVAVPAPPQAIKVTPPVNSALVIKPIAKPKPHQSAVQMQTVQRKTTLAERVAAMSIISTGPIQDCACAPHHLEEAGKWNEAADLAYTFVGDKRYQQGVALNSYAWALAHTSRLEEALEASNLALKNCKQNLLAHVYDTRAYVNLHLGRGAAALADVERAYSLRPSDTFKVRKAQVLAYIGKRPSARDLLATVKVESSDFNDVVHRASGMPFEEQQIKQLLGS